MSWLMPAEEPGWVAGSLTRHLETQYLTPLPMQL